MAALGMLYLLAMGSLVYLSHLLPKVGDVHWTLQLPVALVHLSAMAMLMPFFLIERLVNDLGRR